MHRNITTVFVLGIAVVVTFPTGSVFAQQQKKPRLPQVQVWQKLDFEDGNELEKVEIRLWTCNVFTPLKVVHKVTTQDAKHLQAFGAFGAVIAVPIPERAFAGDLVSNGEIVLHAKRGRVRLFLHHRAFFLDPRKEFREIKGNADIALDERYKLWSLSLATMVDDLLRKDGGPGLPAAQFDNLSGESYRKFEQKALESRATKSASANP